MAVALPIGGQAPLLTVPWQRREPGGVYVGHNRQVWMYRELPLTPLQWEDPKRRLEVGSKLESLLVEIGERSKDIGGVRLTSQNRVVHVFTATFEIPSKPPAGTPAALEAFMDDVLEPLVPAKTLLVGVQLQSSTLAQLAKGKGGLVQKARTLLTQNTISDITGTLDAYQDDFEVMDAIFKRNETVLPRPEALAQLEGWFNLGGSPDAAIAFKETSFQVLGGAEYEISAVTEFGRNSLSAPANQWLLEATTHPDPAKVISIRAELEPPSVTRTRIRQSRRRLLANEEEEAKTGDIGREENRDNLALAENLEEWVRRNRMPWLTNTSILMAREVSLADETYADMLRSVYEIHSKPLENRQLQALREMLPCSSERPNPFAQDINPAMVAYGGLASFSQLGDPTGVWAGTVDPDYVPMFLDVFGASRNNQPPVMGVFGDPGSGKTFATQLLAGQFALAGGTAIFINPKSGDSLASWARWVASMGGKAEVVSMRKVSEQGGAFDPFRFAEPGFAAEILARHIYTVLSHALNHRQEIILRDGLHRGAMAGARCAAEALSYVADPEIVELVEMMAQSSSLFALGFGRVPQEPWTSNGGLTLIEFDRDLPLPKGGKHASAYEPAEREGLAALRLVTRAAIEILIRANGGMLVVDEAHHFLSSEEGLASLDRLAREGRSMGLLPIFATQRVSDLLEVDMETFMSRVLVMKLNDAREAEAALRLCRLEPNQHRLDFLRKAGPRRGGNGVPARSAVGIFRDLHDQHAVIQIGPVPEHVRLAMSTNRDDREARKAQEEAAATTEQERTS